MKTPLVFQSLLCSAAIITAPTLTQAEAPEGPVKIFILAGQSNMEGHGKVEMGLNPEYLQSGMSSDELLSLAVIDLAKSGGQRTFQEVVSRIAPHGAASLEDLPLLDVTNPNEWLLMVAVREGDQTRVYRKLYDLGERTTVIELSAEVTP